MEDLCQSAGDRAHCAIAQNIFVFGGWILGGFRLKNYPEFDNIIPLHSLFTNLRETPEAKRGRRAMFQLSHAVLEGLKSAYTAYYDIEEFEDGTPLKALCAYHNRDSQYVLVKKAELWAAESHEYLYLWETERLDQGLLEEVFRRTLADGEPRVRPHSQHMYTYLTAVVVCGSVDRETLEQLKKLRKRREFRLSLHGWMEFRIAAVELSTGEIVTNRAGRGLGKDLGRLVGRIISNNPNGEEKTL